MVGEERGKTEYRSIEKESERKRRRVERRLMRRYRRLYGIIYVGKLHRKKDFALPRIKAMSLRVRRGVLIRNRLRAFSKWRDLKVGKKKRGELTDRNLNQ